MAMMASASSGNPYDHLNNTQIEQDLIDPDDANINDLDDPTEPHSDRAPLTGNIQSSSRSAQSYLNSTLPGEDRRAPTNTIDETVWDTLSRDLLAVWEKMRQVLWPKYLLGGFLQRGGGLGGAERGEGDSLAGGARGIAGRWPDADVVLQGGMSEGLRDWDLWGPLIFCLLLSLLLSMTASSEQKTVVFSGVFALIWIGEAVVTAQIKLLGGNISFFQSVCIIGYTLFPLVVAALLSAVHLPVIARVPVYIVLVAWSLAAGISILGGSGVVKNRVGIAAYIVQVPRFSLRQTKRTEEKTLKDPGMTSVSNSPGADQQEKVAEDPPIGHCHITDSDHVHLSTNDPASDNDNGERPVREKLKKTSIAAIPRSDASTNFHDPNAEPISRPNSDGSPERNSSKDETPSPISEPRGRLSRKRSYDDTVDTSGGAGEAPAEVPQNEDDVKHARKRSRDVRTVPLDTPDSPATSENETSLQRQSDDGANDQEIEGHAHSPRKKRSREEFDVEAQRGLKIAATDEAKAYRRSEDSERGHVPLPDDKSTFTVDSTVDEEQPSTSEEASALQQAQPQPAESEPLSPEAQEASAPRQAQPQPAEPESLSPEAPEPTSQKTPEEANAEEKVSQKVPTSFAASGFAAMSNSSKSPFGSLGASTSSVFRSNSPGSSAFGMTGSGTKPSDSTTQSITSSASGNSSSPFLASAPTSAASSGFGFGINGAAPKPSGFGGSVFGSAFMNKGAAAPKLTSFAAPTGDLDPTKPAENTKAFGAQTEDSAEEDGGSDGEANPEEVGAADDEVDSRFQQQEGKCYSKDVCSMETGEAGEIAIFTSSRAQLYYFDSGGWHEKGKGAFKLNVADGGGDDEQPQEKKARFIMRAHQTFRVLLNQPVFKKMQVGDSKGREPSGKNFAFAVIDQGRPMPHLLKLSDENESKALYREVLRLQEDMETPSV
ncbi:MAG: hypothetical protein Q9173_006753 [Seirophora scorigena]